MKLSAARVQQAAGQFEANPIPENHPAASQLTNVFGDHTFFLDAQGLHIVEPTEPTPEGKEAGQVVKLASWADEERSSLRPHQPEPSDRVVVLDAEE